jgi:hypothetical protein
MVARDFRGLAKAVMATAPLLLIAQGCAAGTADSGSEIEETDELLTRTIVRTNADGTETVKIVQVTAEEMRAETEMRAALLAGRTDGRIQQTLSADGSCLGSSVWINDQTNQNGNRICFSGTGWVNLGAYCRTWAFNGGFLTCTGYWEDNVRSYWGGEYSGRFANWYACCALGCTESYTAYQQVNNAGSCAQQGDWLMQPSGTCAPCFGD